MLNIIKNTINRVFASGVDSDASAFITATGLSGTTQKSAITTLVKDLKSSGLWSKMKAVYPMVTDNYNLLSYTQDFGTSWTPFTSASVLTNTTTAPDGTLTADTLTFSSNLLSLIYQPYTSTSKTFTISIYAKSSTGKKFCFRNTDGVAEARSADFTTTNQWQRFSYTFTIGLTNVGICNESAGTIGSIDIWGAQLEISSTASTYQPILTTPSAYMASQMKYNLKDARDLDAAFRLTWSGGWTYSATGATPNGTNAYADSKLVPTTSLSQDNTHISFYSRTNTVVDSYDMGAAQASYVYLLGLSMKINATSSANFINDLLPFDYAVADSLGLQIVSRQLSTEIKVNRNALTRQTISKSSITAPSNSIYLGALNLGGTAARFANRQVSFSTIGNGLTDQESFLLNQIVEKYQVALSRGVQAAQSFYYNSAYSNEANTYLYSTQITGTTQVSAINTLINGLKANNLWTKMKAVYPFVTDKSLQADMAAQMKFNLVNPQDSDAAFRLAFSGGWTYSTNGAQPNGTNGYADTKLVENTILTLNSTHISIYSRTNASGLYADIGNNITAETNIFPNLSNTFYPRVQHGNLGLAINYNTAAMFIANRVLSTEVQGWRNNVKNILASNSTGKGTGSMFIGAMNTPTGALYFSTKQLAFSTIGDGLSDAEAALLYQLVQEFQTTLSRNV
jgi:hypothetical protein